MKEHTYQGYTYALWRSRVPNDELEWAYRIRDPRGALVAEGWHGGRRDQVVCAIEKRIRDDEHRDETATDKGN